jgi:hypothetical protein
MAAQLCNAGGVLYWQTSLAGCIAFGDFCPSQPSTSPSVARLLAVCLLHIICFWIKATEAAKASPPPSDRCRRMQRPTSDPLCPCMFDPPAGEEDNKGS